MIRKQLGIFLLVGGSTVLLDYATYELLVRTASMPVDVAKAAGFITGTVFAFFANRSWTFGHRGNAADSAWRFVLLYSVTLAANVGVNAALLSPAWLSLPRHWAFVGATGVSAALNFIGMKYLVFSPSRQGPQP